MSLIKASFSLARLARLPIQRFHQVTLVRNMLTSSAMRCCCEPDPPQPKCPPNVPDTYYKMKRNQDKFKRTDDGVLVWQKNGASDLVLYKLTCVLAIFGVVCVLITIVRLMFKF